MNNDYSDIAFIVTTWEPELFMAIRQCLLSFGVHERNIIKVTDRVSRPKSLNKAWNTIDGYKYVAFIDEDIVIRDKTTFIRLKEILNAPENAAIAGALANPKLFLEGQPLFEIQHDMPPETPWQQSLSECTSFLTSLNCCLFRADLTQRFDEDYFGNQNFDVDFGLQLAFDNKKVVIDRALLVLARANDYFGKSLSYHSIVARNLHVFMVKWSNIDGWKGVNEYNASHNNEIPSIEELTHWPELKQMRYCFAYGRDGISRCYLQSRFNSIIQVAAFVQNIENSLKDVQNLVDFTIPYHGALPIFNMKHDK